MKDPTGKTIYRETIFKLDKDYHNLTPADQNRLLNHIMEWVQGEQRRIADERSAHAKMMVDIRNKK